MHVRVEAGAEAYRYPLIVRQLLETAIDTHSTAELRAPWRTQGHAGHRETSDTLPRTSVGKVDKQALRALLPEGESP